MILKKCPKRSISRKNKGGGGGSNPVWKNSIKKQQPVGYMLPLWLEELVSKVVATLYWLISQYEIEEMRMHLCALNGDNG